MRRFAIILLSTLTLLVGAGIAVAPQAARAQLTSGLDAVGQTVNLPATNPIVLATRIINVSLGLLGIIFLVIIVYAGFLYMTSGGDVEKTQNALAWIRNAVIGLIIILCSWAIARYVIEKLLEATQGGGGTTTGTGPGTDGITPSQGGEAFKIVQITPNGAVGTKKVIVKILFNKPPEGYSNASVTVQKLDGTPVDGTVSVNPNTNRELRFVPAQACPPPHEDLHCFDDSTDYRVIVSPDLKSNSGLKITCGGFAPSCQGAFKSGTTVDVTPPDVSITNPREGQGVSADALVDVNAYISSITGVAYASFNDGANEIGQNAPSGQTPNQFDARVQWDTGGLQSGSKHALTATAYDVDTGVKTSAPVNVVIRAAHCFNGVGPPQDPTETGIDCGGDRNSPDYCGACPGDTCTVDSDCASSVCKNGICVEQPIITSFTPPSGAVGTYVTIKGMNFGSGGKVFFLGSSSMTAVEAVTPQACVNMGIDTWKSTEIVVEVPPGAQSGAIRVSNAGSGLSDDTNALPNPYINDFVVNDTVHPGICGVDPSEGYPGQLFRLVGKGFGNMSSGVQFGNQTLMSTSWMDGEVQALIPNVAEKTYPVTVTVNNIMSNPVDMTVVKKSTGGIPFISSVDPANGPVGTYVTINGQNFGDSVGTVFFKDIALQKKALADTNFPPLCSTSFWSDTSIVVKVPSQFTQGLGGVGAGDYTVQVTTAIAGAPPSNEVGFAVNTNPATPGICGVNPSVAPVGTAVEIIGERFTSGPGTVTFFQLKNGVNTPWTDAKISSSIPTGAVTGRLVVTPSNSMPSNGFLIQVRNCNESAAICKTGEECCANGACMSTGKCTEAPEGAMFAWITSTGIIPRAPRVVEDCRPGSTDIPSPSPWDRRDGGTNACVNAAVVMRFTTRLEPTTVVANNFKIGKCAGTGANPCDATTPVALTSAPELQLANGLQSQDYVIISGIALEPSTTYLVTLTTGIRGLGIEGTNMEENAARCGAGNSYCFSFKTRNDVKPCAIGSVLVSPTPYYAHELGPITDPYKAIPLAQDDACVVLMCETYDWDWKTSDSSRASVSNDKIVSSQGTSLGACKQKASANGETGRKPVNVNASTAGVTGAGDLYVNFLPPVVVDHGPVCDQACINAAIWAVFSTDLDEASVKNPGNVQVRECTNENCYEFVPQGSSELVPLSSVNLITVPDTSDALHPREVDISPAAPLKEGTFYKVTLVGGTLDGIMSSYGVPMAGLNDRFGYSWTFRTRIGEKAFCIPERIAMAPTKKYETFVGARQGFAAVPFSTPDECSAKGHRLVQSGSFDWSSVDPNIANLLLNTNGQLIDTGATSTSGCGSKCTFLGAAGVAGKTAQCGDGIVETTDPKTCPVTNSSCTLLPPDGKGGEECDHGANNGKSDDSCSANCLWNPVKTVGAERGTCGNGVINRAEGEACDFGRSCLGAPATSTTPDGFNCTSDENQTLCQANGGTCAVRVTHGCSEHCRFLGSGLGGSVCGNGSLGDGEACDDGNLQNGDGCSAVCLHEGSLSSTYALCGDGHPNEPGKACDRPSPGAVFPDGCDPVTCLHSGVKPCLTGETSNCCGDNVFPLEPGKDCEDGNSVSGDGCSPTCLSEGSSDKYAIPSFCTDGILGIGEQCESTEKGDGKIDAYQIATIVGNALPGDDGKMQTNINATYSSKTGSAVYGLQCGFTDENMCIKQQDVLESQGHPVDLGLTTQGCCSLRPQLTDAYPPNNSGATLMAANKLPVAGDDFPEGVCRNVLIHGTFNVGMDEQSLQDNLVVAKNVEGASCPNGTTEILASTNAPKGFLGFVMRIWSRILSWFHIPTAFAQQMQQHWCAGSVTGKLAFETDPNTSSTSFFFTLDNALEPNTEYVVRFKGDTSNVVPFSDNSDIAKRWGIKSKSGVVAYPYAGTSGPLSWHFWTGDKICTINNVSVRDLSTEHPYFFTRKDEDHPFIAFAQSFQNGVPVPLSPVKEYSWKWQNWVFSNPNIIRLEPPELRNPTGESTASKDAVAKDVSGLGYLSARLNVMADTVNVPQTTDNVVQGTAHLTVNICENPWPSIASAPFRDEEGSFSLKWTVFEKGPFYNFSVTYCRDAGDPGPNGDLPGMVINAVPSNNVDAAQGILRQYLFTFSEDALKKDAIGIRIAMNPMHLSPKEWYASKGFTGNPQSTIVDGFQAVRDGRTVYVSAPSTNGPSMMGISSDIYSNIYLISYNEGAESVTRQIYDQLLKSFSFLVNVQYEVANACQDSGKNLLSDTNGRPILCSYDWECVKYGDQNYCASFKSKIQRDLVRLSDFQVISRQFDAVKAAGGKYPSLASGSYLPGLSTSLWPSWNETLAKAIGGGALPQDPVNHFLTCGRCTTSGMACSADTDCPQKGETCANLNGFEAQTCWNSGQQSFTCPVLDGGPTSRLYQYRSIQAGSRYELSADFEIPPPDPDLSLNWWKPPLTDQMRVCTNADVKGNYCLTDRDCRSCPLGVCGKCGGGAKNGQACASNADCPGGKCNDTVATVTGSCQPVGGQYRYAGVCTGSVIGESGTCGDGVMDADPTHVSCLGGPNDGKRCTAPSDCPGGSCLQNEICELSGPTAKKFESCTTSDNKAGLKAKACDSCRRYIDDPAHPGCVASNVCGNGRIDTFCNEDPTFLCRTDQDCRNTIVTELQRDLKLLGYDVPAPPNGVYDSQTEAAVRKFQTDQGIAADGLVGPTTKGKLIAAMQAKGQCLQPGSCFKNDVGWLCKGAEACDDGALNGTANHCKTDCTGLGNYCGDAKLSPGELCDNGASNPQRTGNGDYLSAVCNSDFCRYPSITPEQSCNFTCSGPAPYCGNGNVDATEACDGNTERTGKALCSDNATPCTTDADCHGANDHCGANLRTCLSSGKLCAGGSSNGAVCTTDAECGANSRCTGPYQYIRSRHCSNTCSWQPWTDCLPAHACGDGIKDPGEECDEGSKNIYSGGCTPQCKKNVCGDGNYYKGVEECDLGANNGKACDTAEYGSTCSSCSKDCKMQLTQGGFCGNNTVDPGSPEQCDGQDLGSNGTNLFCKGLGYDYADRKSMLRCAGGLYLNKVCVNNDDCPGSTCEPGSKRPFPPKDYITCNSSCTFSGCASCGDTPGTGVVGGYLVDSLFQQPVSNARVTIFYRGLQQNVTTSDSAGFFSIANLDTHAGCDQYKIVIDSYDDNPNTDLMDEGKRGGYLPVSVGPFASNEGSFNDAVTSQNLGWTKTSTAISGSNSVAVINMLPRLGPNEYVVQFWWDPIAGNWNPTDRYSIGIQKTLDAFPSAGSASEKADFYKSKINDYHDLVIRMPFTYTPGTFGKCAISPKPVPFDNTKGDICANRVGDDPKKPFTPACSSVDYTLTSGAGNNYDRFLFAIKGMENCTNKIRATASHTCVSANGSTNLGCSEDWDCQNPGKYNWDGAFIADAQKVKCTGEREPSREGSPKALNGEEGAYLFCYHPEDASIGSSCTNFIVPPQSAFIEGKGGQYDVIVSQFRMFDSGKAYGPTRIHQWLIDHKGEIRVYDKNGLYKTWNYADLIAKQNVAWPPEWPGSSDVLCPNGKVEDGMGDVGDTEHSYPGGKYPGTKGDTKTDTATKFGTGWPPGQYKTLYNTFAGGVNSAWVPVSIDTTNKVVNEWNATRKLALDPNEKTNGMHLAAYRSFADLYTMDGFGGVNAGSAWCYYNACSYSTLSGTCTAGLYLKSCQNDADCGVGGKCTLPVPNRFPPEGSYLCNDGASHYTSKLSQPACDAKSQGICQKNYPATECAKRFTTTGEICVQFCDNSGQSNDCLGPVLGSDGQARVEAFCGGPFSCEDVSSVLQR